jgi:hypothetical protein
MSPYLGTKIYALVVDNEFVCEYRHPKEGSDEIERIVSILSSDPKIRLTDDNSTDNLNRYELLIDGDVVGQIFYIKEKDVIPSPLMVNAALQSDPRFVDISDLSPRPQVGWLWDGAVFSSPDSQN